MVVAALISKSDQKRVPDCVFLECVLLSVVLNVGKTPNAFQSRIRNIMKSCMHRVIWG